MKAFRLVVVAVVSLMPATALAVMSCKVKINSKTGIIDVSATGLSGAPTWGDRAGGPYPNSFVNDAACVAGTSATKCEIGAPGSAESMTPPDLCTFYLKDAGAECAAHIKGCTPGIRPTDAAKADAMKELVNAISFHHSIPTIQFSGVNVHIVSGSGGTDGPTNGAGNLIIGYNEDGGAGLNRAGSHNLIIGRYHAYGSYSGIVAATQ